MEEGELTKPKKKIALVAHASRMEELLGWVAFYRDFLDQYEVYTTGETVNILVEKLHLNNVNPFQPQLLDSRQKIEPNESLSLVDFLVFFWTPSEALPDDPDIQALLAVATTGNIPIAGNRSAADFLFPLFLASAKTEII
jgi:methylglyoxal synthase